MIYHYLSYTSVISLLQYNIISGWRLVVVVTSFFNVTIVSVTLYVTHRIIVFWTIFYVPIPFSGEKPHRSLIIYRKIFNEMYIFMNVNKNQNKLIRKMYKLRSFLFIHFEQIKAFVWTRTFQGLSIGWYF